MIRYATFVLSVILTAPAFAAGPARPCVTVADCPGGWVCEFPEGDCALLNGTCEPAPICDPQSGPVCGCDGVTYNDECEAEAAGAVVDFIGLCPVGNPCGEGLPDCFPGQVCEFPLGDCDHVNGTCVTETTCDPNSGLVCGCLSGGHTETYTSECAAEADGAVVKHLGVCQTGASCGGQTCTGNNFCQLPPGACGQFEVRCYVDLWEQLHETLGMCVPYPADCPAVDDPVCACGQIGTYANECEAARDLKSVRHFGPCNEACGGPFMILCSDPSDICVKDCSCFSLVPGFCEPPPTVCDDTCAPVCACDNQWYRNRCEALVGGAHSMSLNAGCAEAGAVRFISKTEMMFAAEDYGVTFNVYQAPLTVGVSPAAWSCVASGLTAGEHAPSGVPGSGEVWALAVTEVDSFTGVEGPLGWGGAGCTERVNTTPCPP